MNVYDPPRHSFTGASVILFNGPPRCGKDTAAKHIHLNTQRSRVMKFAGMLKRSTHMDFGLPTELPDDAFETCKDEPNPAFFGQTPRQAYIDKSEKRQKPFLGEDIYGRVLLRRMWRAYQEGVRVFLISDSGFEAEAKAIMKVINHSQFMLVRIHADGRGCTFKGDSRDFIHLPGVHTVNLVNDDDMDAFKSEVLQVVTDFINWGDGQTTRK